MYGKLHVKMSEAYSLTITITNIMVQYEFIMHDSIFIVPKIFQTVNRLHCMQITTSVMQLYNEIT